MWCWSARRPSRRRSSRTPRGDALATHRDEGQGKVAVHRWFKRGAGWAYDGWYAGRFPELLRALDGVLKAAALGPFEVPGLGGVLVGSKDPDPGCDDPHAAG